MKYLLMIASDGVTEPETAAVMQGEVPKWVDEMDGRGVRLLGRPLHARETAATVRVRDGQTLVSDGPYTESKEWIGGFDIIDCADLDEAIEVAAKHPVSRFHQIEIRPFYSESFFGEFALGAAGEAYARGESEGDPAYLMLMFIDGIPGEPAEEEAIRDACLQWATDVEASGRQIAGHPVQPRDTATTVRVRDGETLISDGPFVETHEFIGGFDIVRCASREEAIELAAKHPLAKLHAVEVREIWDE